MVSIRKGFNMAKAKTAEKTYTQADIDAMLAKAREEAKAEGKAEARKEKSTARAEKNAAREKAGWTLFTTTDERKGNNILAEGVFVVPGVCTIEATAVMVKRDTGFMPRYRLAANPIFGVNGDTDTDAERLIRACEAKAKNAGTMLAALAKEYAVNAPSHTWRDKAAERKAAKAEA
jgi:hypothetical protein